VPRGAQKKTPGNERRLRGVFQEMLRAMEDHIGQGEGEVRGYGEERQGPVRRRDGVVHPAPRGPGKRQEEEGPQRTQKATVRFLCVLLRPPAQDQGGESGHLHRRHGEEARRVLVHADHPEQGSVRGPRRHAEGEIREGCGGVQSAVRRRGEGGRRRQEERLRRQARRQESGARRRRRGGRRRGGRR